MTSPFYVFVDVLNRWGEVHWQFAVAMLVQVSLLVIVLIALDRALLCKLRATIRYAVWMLVLVKLMLPVSLSSPISVAQWLPALPAKDSVTSISYLPGTTADNLFPPNATVVPFPSDVDALARTKSRPRTISTSLPTQGTTNSVMAAAPQDSVARVSDVAVRGASLHWKGKLFA